MNTSAKKTVVLVDDEQSIIDSLRRTLHNEGYNLATFTNAKEALNFIQENRGNVDVIVSDNMMPELKGVDFFIQVKKHYPNVVRIMLTGQSNLEDAQNAINEGKVYKFLLKPCKPDELRAVIKKAIAQRQLWIQYKTLMKRLSEQEKILLSLEKNYPGITRIETDQSGRILISDTQDETLEDFMSKYCL
jgi:DNA-binding NtrC family response regulator